MNFISEDLNDLEGQFDLIILSHSIMYIPDLNYLMISINHLLKDNGILFIQIPNIKANKLYSLMGDQNFIFTEISLKNVLFNFGYKVRIIKNDFFPRELLIIAKKGQSSTVIKEDNLFEKNIEKINLFRYELEKINEQNLAVLGTTINAAFVHEIIGQRIQFFVEENISKIGKTFRGEEVVNPKYLNDTSHTLLPYGELGYKIQERFQSKYNGDFKVVL